MLATTSHHTARLTLMLLLAATAVALPGCRGDRSDKSPRQFLPDMDDQPKWNSQSETPFFADGSSQRLPVEGAVAFGRTSLDPSQYGDKAWAASDMAERARMLHEDDTLYFGVMPGSDHAGDAAEFVDYMPVPMTRELIERGRERFTIYCTPCHGYLGDGGGTVAKRWSLLPANLVGGIYSDRAMRTGKDGYIFHVIRNGLWTPDGETNRMPSYGHAIDEHDAWAVVAYIRTLQASQTQIVDDLPEALQERLDAMPVDAASEGGDE